MNKLEPEIKQEENKQEDEELKINEILEQIEDEELDKEIANENPEQEKQIVNSELDEALILEWPATIIIAGSTNTGKSELMKNIVYKNYKNFNRIFLLCPFAKDKFYNFIPDTYKITDVSDADLNAIYKDCCENPHIKTLIIADDCISKIDFSKGAASRIISATGRHVNLSLIIIMQYLNNISPIVRDNSKYLFVTKLKSHCVDSIYKMTSCFNSKTECKRFLDAACKDYNVVRFNLTGYNTKEYFVFKNKKSRNFVIESKVIQK